MRFVLIHGGFHGAWCWERLIPELEDRAMQAVAIDLPATDLVGTSGRRLPIGGMRSSTS